MNLNQINQSPVVTELSNKATNVSVAASGYVLLLELDGPFPGPLLNVEVSNVGSVALNHFKIQLLDHTSGDWYDYLSDTDFTLMTNPNVMFCTTVVPASLAAGAQAHVQVRINAAIGVRVYASVASGTGTISTYGTVSTS